jgi:hypothetical protein
MAHEENRLTEDDMSKIRKGIDETVRVWLPLKAGPRELGADLVALERIGRHAIGCGPADLRDSELEWIAAAARAALAAAPAPRRRVPRRR